MCFRFNCALAMLLICCATVPSRATVFDGPFVNPANQHTYYLLDTTTWTASETQAAALGGTLAIVNDAAENTWIFNTFDSDVTGIGDMWIGMHDPTQSDGTGAQHAADFAWIDGTTVSYTNWSNNEPNNDANNGGEYYAAMSGYAHNGQTPGKWNDKNNNGSVTPAYGVVEVVPEPSTCAVGFALVICLHFLRRTIA